MNTWIREVTNTRTTYRMMLNLYWLTIVLTLLLEVTLHTEHGSPLDAAVLRKLLEQGLLLAAVTGAAEMLYRFRKIHNDYLMMMTGTVYACSIIEMNPHIGIVPAILIFPLLSSVLSFKRERILGAFALALFAFLVVYWWNPALREAVSSTQLIGILFLYAGVTAIALVITSSGIELLSHLRQTTDAKQELMVKTIIMDKLSKMDALTDLYNHKTFHEYLEKLIEHSERNQLRLQLAILDIDNFKKINDTYGHWVGDIILTRVAVLLKETVISNDFVARYGGEEFAIIFTDKSVEEAYSLAETIRTRLAAWSHPELGDQAATISIGLQEYTPGCGKEMLFKGADASLYKAKRTGKNQTVMHGFAPSGTGE